MRDADAPVRVMLVDDHELIRHGLALAFGQDDQMEVVGQAGTVAEALRRYEECSPDVVVTDLSLPDGTGLDIVRALRERSSTVGLVVLTMHAGDEHIFAAMGAGASGFVGKDARAAEVVNTARHSVVAPRTFLCTGLPKAMMRRASNAAPRLSAREQEVLELLAEGMGTGMIARRLHLSESTAKTHITRIYQKLDAGNRAQALVTAMRLGLLSSVVPTAR